MKYFSIPSDFNKETIKKYAELNSMYSENKLIETYGNITKGFFLSSGRSVEALPKIGFNELEEYIKFSKTNGINFNYTINSSHMGNREFDESQLKKIIKFIENLRNIGVENLTVTLPSIFELIKSLNYDFNLKVSVICQVTNANKALEYRNSGINRLVIDESIIRDFSELKRIRHAFGDGIEVIINAICSINCIYRMFHYNQISEDSLHASNEKSINYYVHRCLIRRHENPGNLLRLGWIRPEDLHYYEAIGINHFKIQGRDNIINGDPVRVLKAYFNESYNGNLMKLLDVFDSTMSFTSFIDNKKLEGFIKPFVENERFCKKYCDQCKYCNNFAELCVDKEKTNEIYSSATNFYKEFDGYSKMITKLKEEEKSNNSLNNHIDFNL